MPEHVLGAWLFGGLRGRGLRPKESQVATRGATAQTALGRLPLSLNRDLQVRHLVGNQYTQLQGKNVSPHLESAYKLIP